MFTRQLQTETETEIFASWDTTPEFETWLNLLLGTSAEMRGSEFPFSACPGPLLELKEAAIVLTLISIIVKMVIVIVVVIPKP